MMNASFASSGCRGIRLKRAHEQPTVAKRPLNLCQERITAPSHNLQRRAALTVKHCPGCTQNANNRPDEGDTLQQVENNTLKE
jgi:hypothetical protein